MSFETVTCVWFTCAGEAEIKGMIYGNRRYQINHDETHFREGIISMG